MAATPRARTRAADRAPGGGPMGISAAPGMTSEEIVALSREHTIFSWSVQGALDPIAIDRAEGVYLYTPEGKRILDFNSPADVGQHRPRRPACRRRDHRAGDPAPVRPARVRDRDPRPPRPEAGRDPARRHGQGVLHPGRRRGDRERDQARAPPHRPLQAARPLPQLPRRHVRRDDAHRRLPPLGERARAGGRRPLPRHAPLGREGAAAGRGGAQRPRGRHQVRGRPHDRRGVPRDDRGHQRDPHPARRLPQGRPRAVRQVRDPDGRRRGHGGLRPDRALVRGRPLGRRARPDDDGQGPDLAATCRWAPSPCASTSPRASRTRCSTAG